MSLSNSITKLLNFKEDNLIFDENFFEIRTIKNKKCFVIKGYLFKLIFICFLFLLILHELLLFWFLYHRKLKG